MSSQTSTTKNLSPRLERFRSELAKAIPVFPNTKIERGTHQAKHLPQLLIDYVSWKARLVGTRPRTVTVSAIAKACPAWSKLQREIDYLLKKVRSGGDLLPHLSSETKTRAVNMKLWQPGDSKWHDKDFILTTMGYHHFHLGFGTDMIARSNELVFAQVSRDTFHVIAILDHSVFTPGTPANQLLAAIHEKEIFHGLEPGTVVVSNPITTSAHSLHHVDYASTCNELLFRLDQKCDDADFLQETLKVIQSSIRLPLRLQWYFAHLDLGLYDEEQGINIVVQKGWN
jgi:hypothetical protein